MSLEEYVDVCLNLEETAMRYASGTGISLVDVESAEEGPDCLQQFYHARLRPRNSHKPRSRKIRK